MVVISPVLMLWIDRNLGFLSFLRDWVRQCAMFCWVSKVDDISVGSQDVLRYSFFLASRIFMRFDNAPRLLILWAVEQRVVLLTADQNIRKGDSADLSFSIMI